ncbi:alpha/beta hydrolase [Limnohabitans sp. T6-5]|uniref:YqiA/YcfP family alpha/beta fold hydrolase n=1 Tax=Limnohabitans sp. T6-5 TaxID=1100724 RepID=UPI000D37B403|nr:YqiA/YcfP family alpha/beta fold hydrolase [Limnohabitans sp. T6-5]PUE09049.1 alpha/beta hydrolase [Limnohabitans sp. T6-5]
MPHTPQPHRLLVVFSHGKESGPLGTKIRALMQVAERLGAATLSVNYREHPAGVVHDQDAPGESDRRVAQLCATALPVHDQLVLVGSSMGGYVSTVASQNLPTSALFLLAPAFFIPGYAVQQPQPGTQRVHIVHGWGDAVVPVAHSIRFAQQHGCQLHLLEGDHRLNAAMPTIEHLFAQFLTRVFAGTGPVPPFANRSAP